MNNRTHRKLLVIDGRTGFIGGVGIADAWRSQAQAPQHWRDMHYRIKGPLVAKIQAAFLNNWVAHTGQLLLGQKYLPPLEAVGTYAVLAQSRTVNNRRISPAALCPIDANVSCINADMQGCRGCPAQPG